MSGQCIQRGERTFLIRVFKGRDGNGKRIYVSKTIHGTRRDAERELRKLLTGKDAGQLIDPSNESLAKYLRRWLDSAAKAQLRKRTWLDYQALIRRYIEPELGPVRLSRLTPMEIQTLYTKMQERGLSPRTIRYTHAVLRSALNQAIKWRLLALNPATLVALPKSQRRELQVLNRDQANAFLAAAEQHRFHALWVLLLTTGMRPGEALALRWSDLSDGRASIHRTLVQRSGIGRVFEAPKTAKSRRSLPLLLLAQSALAKHRRRQAEEKLLFGAAYQDQGLIFANQLGGPLDIARLSRKFRKLNQKARMPDSTPLPQIRMYDLRHSHVTLMLAAGANLKVVSERVGHSNINITADIYAAVLPDMQREATESLDRFLNGNGKPSSSPSSAEES
jgi:integrase